LQLAPKYTLDFHPKSTLLSSQIVKWTFCSNRPHI
jgi:hypothetical protein